MARRIGDVPYHARIDGVAIGLAHRQREHPLVERAVQPERAIGDARRRIAQHPAPRFLARRTDIGAFDQPQRQPLGGFLIGGVERIAHEIVPTRPPSTNTVLPVV